MKIINNLESQKKFNIGELLNFLSKELNISENVELTLLYNDKLLDKLSNSIKYDAILCCMFAHNYVLHVRTNIDLKHILCHEMVHLNQYERGDLKISSDYVNVTGKNITYNSSYPYEEREGEKEAFEKQSKLGRKFKQMKKRQRKNYEH